MKHLVRSLVISLLCSGLGVAWLLWQVKDVRQLLLVMSVPLSALFLAFGGLLFSFATAAIRLHILARSLGHSFPLLASLYAHIMGVFGTTVTPGGSGGTPLLAYVLSRHMPQTVSWAIALFILTADMILYAWALPLSVVYLFILDGEVAASTLILAAISIVSCMLLALILLKKLHWLERLIRLLCRGILLRFRKTLLRSLQRVASLQQDFLAQPFAWQLGIQGLSALSWAGFFLIFYSLAKGFDFQVGLWESLAMQQVVVAFATIVPTPGASGFFELSLGKFLQTKGDIQAIPATIMLWRLISYYLFFLLGPLFGGLLIIQHSKTSSPSV